jgi:hypothetical protein
MDCPDPLAPAWPDPARLQQMPIEPPPLGLSHCRGRHRQKNAVDKYLSESNRIV